MVSVSLVAVQADNPVKGRRSFLLKYKRGVLNSINNLMLLGYAYREQRRK
jgi:hypothetical protein